MKQILTETEARLQEIVLEHTRLALEHMKIYNQPNCEKRLQEIQDRIEELRKERDELLKR
ncbi:hypothetical protein [Caminicella sporogenes]|uniref:hypothetical protein n=1 Tax=Caminicella sporogenes TaxID=166485 RepID=UPI002540C3DA|nr:hypothetical protein [Caminicella sporogenes]WIF95054.1 hypothetical protein QNI18_12455 [Caminicella sporogenes]